MTGQRDVLTTPRAASSGTSTTWSSSAPAGPGCAPRSPPTRPGAETAIVCKSLLGKAHTVMAEGGIAAAMGNRWPEDNWQVHFRDTMRGGKMLNNWRMAQLHAQEAPERVLELEDWGALFDRTEDGLICQRDFGGHRYAAARPRRRPHRAGDDPHPAAARGPARHRRLHGVHGHRAAQGRGRRDLRRLRLLARDRPLRRLRGAVRRPGDRRHRQVLQGDVELLGVHRRRARARAARRRVADQHGVRAVPPDRHGLAARR